ncbi:MAG: alpha-amylase family glycosyl hydrolase [Polyangiaceae bacterium]
MSQISTRVFSGLGLAVACVSLAACSGDTGEQSPKGFGEGGSSQGGSAAQGGNAGAAGGSGEGGSAGGGSGGTSNGGTAGTAQGGSAGTSSGGTAGTGGVAADCPVSLTYDPPAGKVVNQVAIAGEWNGFSASALPMQGPDSQGNFHADFTLPPGLHGYKLVLDGTDWVFDPAEGYRKYVGQTENSGLRVADCTRPQLSVESSAKTLNSFTAKIDVTRAVSGAAISSVSVSHRSPSGEQTAPSTLTGDTIDLSLSGLGQGKHTLVVHVQDANGQLSDDLLLPFWIESSDFSWQDAVIYMALTDRFEDGDTGNDPGPTSGVTDARADWNGGDFDGLRARIADGTLDALGVRALWLTPFQTNPAGAYGAADGVHQVTGYHGYWPVEPRTVEPRLGGEVALKALVKEAHAHGIRVLMDFVLNHVHENHPYVTQHPDWFRTGCVCGTSGCDWTDKRLECLFTDYLPDVNWTVTAASEQFVDDAVWWLREFDLDGLRVDAVKHVEDAAIRNLATRVRQTFEGAGDRYFMMGETAMGWSDCSVDCNKSQYDTISNYIGPYGLDGQFDFVLYHAVPYRVFAYQDKGLLHADYWTQQSQLQYPQGSIMTPFIGSHDSSRFVSISTYRGQSGYDRSVAFNQWSNLPSAPPNSEPYARQRVALAWLLTLPGAPLLYYGDEYGQFGGADPDNRAMWRAPGALSSDETTTLNFTRKVGQARRELAALRRGDYRSLYATETFLAYARVYMGQVAIVALSLDPNATSTQVSLPVSLGLSDGTSLTDRVNGGSLSVSGGKLTINLTGFGASILAP